MGNCCGLCGDGGEREEEYRPVPSHGGLSAPSGHRRMTDMDREAQAKAAEAAQARAQQFQQTPVGRAAYKAVKEAKKQDARDSSSTAAQDWLT
eukprot:evm.model.scf_150EXC.3 EVM.evm.TU.scf_150EXC.3   scf_150EXC:23643-26216(+)